MITVMMMAILTRTMMSRWEQYWAERGYGICIFGYILFILMVMFCKLSYGKEANNGLRKRTSFGLVRL